MNKMTFRRQLVSQLIAIVVLIAVLFPVLWIISMSLDPTNSSRPSSLIPAGASLNAYLTVLQ